MRLLLLILSAFILAGCTSVKINNTLKDVESYISERPDSALAVIESIGRIDLKSKRSKAHHALLHAMALDKNYIDVTDDSLANVAVNFFSKHGPKKYLARSLYYKGLSYFYDGQYDKSIIELSKAEPIAEVYDSLYLGFVKILQADIHNLNYNSIEEISAIEKAYTVYTLIKNDYYINIAKSRLSQAYISEERYDEANDLLIGLLYSVNLDERLNNKVMGDYAFLLGTRPDADYEASVSYYEKVAEVGEGRYLSKQDYWVWAHALAEIGDFDRSQQIVDMLSPIDTSCTAYYWQYEIAKIKGNTSEALNLFERFSDKNNEEVVQILRQSISTVQRDYYQSQYEISDYKVRVHNLILLVVIISSSVIILLISFYTIQYRRRKEEEKEQYIRYAEEVNRQLRDFQTNNYSSLQKKYISMYKRKYETLKTLFDKYIQSEGRIDAEKMIYKQVVSLIKDLRKDIENCKKFERTLDADLNGVMTHLRREFPSLKEKDYTLFGYLALGFDAYIISHFMGCSPNSVYINKSRLKKLIEASETEHRSEFMEIIS